MLGLPIYGWSWRSRRCAVSAATAAHSSYISRGFLNLVDQTTVAWGVNLLHLGKAARP